MALGRFFEVAGCVLLVFAVLIGLQICFGVAQARPFPSDWVDIGETYININFTGATPYVVYFDGYIVDAVDTDFVGFHGLEPGSNHQISLHVDSPATAFIGEFRTLYARDYFSLGFLFLVVIVCLYLSMRSWVFLAPAAWLSISLISFTTDIGYPWYFGVLAGFCFVAATVLSVVIFMRTTGK